jgi:hypothetical protein
MNFEQQPQAAPNKYREGDPLLQKRAAERREAIKKPGALPKVRARHDLEDQAVESLTRSQTNPGETTDDHIQDLYRKFRPGDLEEIVGPFRGITGITEDNTTVMHEVLMHLRSGQSLLEAFGALVPPQYEHPLGAEGVPPLQTVTAISNLEALLRERT